MIDFKRDQNLKLISILWAYQTPYKVFTWAILFYVLYRIEIIILIEFEVLSLYIVFEKRLLTFQPLEE